MEGKSKFEESYEQNQRNNYYSLGFSEYQEYDKNNNYNYSNKDGILIETSNPIFQSEGQDNIMNYDDSLSIMKNIFVQDDKNNEQSNIINEINTSLDQNIISHNLKPFYQEEQKSNKINNIKNLEIKEIKYPKKKEKKKNKENIIKKLKK